MTIAFLSRRGLLAGATVGLGLAACSPGTSQPSPSPLDNNRADPEPENFRIITEQTGKNQTLAD